MILSMRAIDWNGCGQSTGVGGGHGLQHYWWCNYFAHIAMVKVYYGSQPQLMCMALVVGVVDHDLINACHRLEWARTVHKWQ